MVGRYWGLSQDPFMPGGGPFVSCPGHSEAVERLVYAVESGERMASLRAPAGLGKTRVVAETLRRLRSPQRKLARVESPSEEVALWEVLAGRIGARSRAAHTSASAWRCLEDAVRLCRWQGQGVVLVVDHAQFAGPSADWRRLAHIDLQPATRLTLIVVGREVEWGEEGAESWELAIRLPPLSRDETTLYLEAKLADAGRAEPTFTPRAVTRIQALAGGVPRGVDRLASLALMAGAARRLEIVTPDVVDGVERECTTRGALTGPGRAW